MKVIDYVIGASLIGCMFIGYSGHRMVALLLLVLTLILASWRFWDQEQADGIDECGGSGELNPELDHHSHDDHSGPDIGSYDAD